MAKKIDMAGGAAAGKNKESALQRKFVSMSKREQLLVCIGVIAVMLIVAVFLVILPGLTTLSDRQVQADDLYEQEVSVQTDIAQLGVYTQMYNDARDLYDKTSKRFFEPMKPEVLDEKVTSYILSAGFDPQTLQLNPLGVEVLPNYFSLDEEMFNAILKGGEETGAPLGEGGTDGVTGAEPGEQAGDDIVGAPVFVYTVGVTVAGEWSNLYSLIDDLKGKSAVVLDSYQYNMASAVGNSQQNDSFIMVFKLYVSAQDVSAGQAIGANVE